MSEHERAAVEGRIVAIKAEIKRVYSSHISHRNKSTRCCRLLDEMSELFDLLERARPAQSMA